MNNLKATHTLQIHMNAEGDKLCLANPSNDDSSSYRIAGPKAWGGSSLIEDIEIRESDLVTYIKEYAPHLAPLIASNLIEQLQQRVVELEAQVPKWVSVEDELPPKDVWVLWIDGKQTMTPHNATCHIDKIDNRGECLVNYIHNYSHWMPLPQPPKGEGE